MKTINIDKLVKELDEERINYAMGDASVAGWTVDESAVIAQVLDIVIETIKEATTHAHIVIEEEE